MTELETQIWNTVHNWCDAQSHEIPDQNRRYLMDEIKALVLSHVSYRLLRELRQMYLVNVNTDDQPKASIAEIMDLWDRVNRELQIVTID